MDDILVTLETAMAHVMASAKDVNAAIDKFYAEFKRGNIPVYIYEDKYCTIMPLVRKAMKN